MLSAAPEARAARGAAIRSWTIDRSTSTRPEQSTMTRPPEESACCNWSAMRVTSRRPTDPVRATIWAALDIRTARPTGNNNSIHEVPHGGETRLAVTGAGAFDPVSDRSVAGGVLAQMAFYCRVAKPTGKSLTERY